MKISKFFAIAIVAVLAVATMGFFTTKTYAKSNVTQSGQVQVTEAPEDNEADGPDTDDVEEQVGDQDEDGLTGENETQEAEESDGVDEAPSGTPAINSDAAIQAAQNYLNISSNGTANLEDENGTLVYSVDLDGKDVKVDAITGTVLGVDQIGDSETGESE